MARIHITTLYTIESLERMADELNITQIPDDLKALLAKVIWQQSTLMTLRTNSNSVLHRAETLIRRSRALGHTVNYEVDPGA